MKEGLANLKGTKVIRLGSFELCASVLSVTLVQRFSTS